jgi:small subunit ribosomal protein S3|tara:strand:+ start:3592 stop:4242 length:651 start_codon:yes stop_codon:yes gene_type:complete
MGQKVNPFAYRLAANKRDDVRCSSAWYANKDNYKDYLHADIAARKYINAKFVRAGIGKIEIERPAQNAHVIIYCSRPGILIGKKGADSDELRLKVSSVLKCKAHITVKEIKKPDLNSKLVAMSVCQQLEKRSQFRKVMKRSVQSTIRAGALGIKICVAGRIGGAEIARSEWCKEGRVPLHTLRANIDYATYEAHTTYGIIGVKVWIYLGDVDSKAN